MVTRHQGVGVMINDVQVCVCMSKHASLQEEEGEEGDTSLPSEHWGVEDPEDQTQRTLQSKPVCGEVLPLPAFCTAGGTEEEER